MKGSKRKVDRPRTSVPDTASNPLGVRTLEERRALILETAASRFEAKGYAGTSVDEIARELGITKAAVYHYWGSKEELLEGIQDRAHHRHGKVALQVAVAVPVHHRHRIA